MKKIDSQNFVCNANQSQQLIGLGILPIACMCYESIGGAWEYAGEFIGQKPVLPAWTMAEFSILIGGDFPKPDLYSIQDWVNGVNMNKTVLYLPKKRIDFTIGAEAYAAFLIHLLTEKKLKPEDCNARLVAFAEDERYNPQSDKLEANG